MEQALRFKAMYARLGFSVADVAKFLQVTPRTVHAWVSGRVRIPFAAYKLLRIQLHYELPGQAWNGWHLSAGRLYTPEGHQLDPHEFTWWNLLVRQARSFRAAYQANFQLRTVDGAGACDAPAAGRSQVDLEGAEGVSVLVTPHFSPENRTGRPQISRCETCRRTRSRTVSHAKGGAR